MTPATSIRTRQVKLKPIASPGVSRPGLHDRSLDFYANVGFGEIGRVSFEDGSILVMLNLPGDGEVVTLELVYDPKLDSIEVGTGISHIMVQVNDFDAKPVELREKGVTFDEPQRPAGGNGPRTPFHSRPGWTARREGTRAPGAAWSCRRHC